MARKTKTTKRTRSNDRAAVQRERSNAVSFWESMRERFAPELQQLGDTAAERMTLRDLRALEVAELVELDRALETTTSTKARWKLINAKMQSRKNLAALVIADGGALDLNNMPVRVPIGFDLEGMQAAVDELDALELGGLDLGDEVMVDE